MNTLFLVGAGPDIGLPVAARFGQGGFRLRLFARTEKRLREACAGFAAKGITADYTVADAADCSGFQEVLRRVLQAHGTPEMLVYNAASLNLWKGYADHPVGALADDLAASVIAPFAAVQAVAPAMAARRSGTILLTSATAENYLPARLSPLRIAKPATNELAKVLHRELRPHGVHLTAMKVRGPVRVGGDYDPAAVAEGYWRTYFQPTSEWRPEEELTAEVLGDLLPPNSF